MTVVYPYSDEFDPSAPVLPLECRGPGSDSAVELLALVDSPADISVIPQDTVSRLGLRRTDVIPAVGFEGRPSDYHVYAVFIGVAGHDLGFSRAIAWENSYALVGRDIANRWPITLDGPDQTMTVYYDG